MSHDVTQIVTSFFERVRTTRALGAGTPETSYYEAVKSLMDAVGVTLSPHVYCLSQLANTGAGSPDFGLYAAGQLQHGESRPGQPPARGVIEMKGVADDTLFTFCGQVPSLESLCKVAGIDAAARRVVDVVTRRF